jgi:predicted RNA binding protein YcfA (HicA-like mRNA interferase family)
MNRRRLLARLARGALHNVAFGDIVNLAQGFGFVVTRISGSHHILAHPVVPELVNIQKVGRQAKPYQIRQFLRLVERYNLTLEEDR